MCRIITFVSPGGGMGKTSIILLLAESLAKQKRRVCVFDGMFALNDLSLRLERQGGSDLCDYLGGGLSLISAVNKAEGNFCFVKTNNPKFDYLVKHELVAGFVEEISHDFDFLLIECNSSDFRNLTLFLSVANEVILIASQDVTQIRNSIRLLNKIYSYKNISNVKVILNKFWAVGELEHRLLGVEDIQSVLKTDVIFVFPKFFKNNIFNNQKSRERASFGGELAASIESNFRCQKTEPQKEYFGLIGKLKRQLHKKFE